MIKQIFTWWNSQTIGTFLYTIFFGKFVGVDEYGNKYYENRQKNKRWVIYHEEINASKITSEWYLWMHFIFLIKILQKKIDKYSWQKPHMDNKTGTEKAYRPNKISKKAKTFKKI